MNYSSKICVMDAARRLDPRIAGQLPSTKGKL